MLVVNLRLFVWDHDVSHQIPADVRPASDADLEQTKLWQTLWTSGAAKQMPNKVALCRTDNGELLGLMSYELDQKGLAVEVIYIESAGHSNANLLRISGQGKKYVGIAKALLAYAVQVSLNAGFDGVLYFRAKTDRLREYYMQEFHAVPVGRFDPYRLVIWEDAARELAAVYRREKP